METGASLARNNTLLSDIEPGIELIRLSQCPPIIIFDLLWNRFILFAKHFLLFLEHGNMCSGLFCLTKECFFFFFGTWSLGEP